MRPWGGEKRINPNVYARKGWGFHTILWPDKAGQSGRRLAGRPTSIAP
jgi:hypothetical protein